jgi:putative oxidoreductase
MSMTAQRDASPAGGESSVQRFAELAARVLLAALFLISGLGKIGEYQATAAVMVSAGVPGELLPIVIALEILGALALIVGWKTRIVSFLLAGFTLLAGVIFHGNLGDPQNQVHLLKNLSIAGGFLLLTVNGAGPLSVDRRGRS